MQRTSRLGAVVHLVAAGLDAQVADARAAVGGGGAPGVELPSAALSLPESLAVPLRCGPAVSRGEVLAVVGRLEAGGSRPTIVTLERVAHALGLQLEVRFHDRQRTAKPRSRRSPRKVLLAGAER